MLECKKYIRGIEPGSILFEPADLRKVEEELAAWAILEDKEELSLALKGVVHLHNEGVPHSSKDAALSHCVLNLVSA